MSLKNVTNIGAVFWSVESKQEARCQEQSVDTCLPAIAFMAKAGHLKIRLQVDYLRVIKIMPVMTRAAPINWVNESRSPSNMAAKKIVKIGSVLSNIDVLTGPMISRPISNVT